MLVRELQLVWQIRPSLLKDMRYNYGDKSELYIEILPSPQNQLAMVWEVEGVSGSISQKVHGMATIERCLGIEEADFNDFLICD